MMLFQSYHLLKRVACCAVGVAAAVCTGWAQDAPPKPADKPLELPQIVIEGTEKINVPGGKKKTPEVGITLLPSELSKLNSLEKHPPSLLATQSLPTLQRVDNVSYNGFVSGQIGMFLTPSVMAGYKTDISGFDIYARGGVEASQGHVDNGDYSHGFVGVQAGYLAPDKYWLFGGSKTESYFRYEGQSYHLYALPNAPERSVREFDLGLTVQGTYEGLGYNAGAGIDNMVMTQAGDVSNSSLFGHVAVHQLLEGFRVGGKLALDFRTLRGEGYNFVEAAATGEYLSDPVLVAADVGIQAGKTSEQQSQVSPLIHGRAEFRLNRDITVRGNVHVGLRNTSFRTLVHNNPYLDDSSHVRYTGVLPELGGTILFHPSATLLISGGVTLSFLRDMPVYLSTGRGTFRPAYADARMIEFSGETTIAVDTATTITGVMVVRSTALADTGSGIPYTPSFQVGGTVERRWIPSLTTSLTLKYTGQRYADMDNTIALDGYVDIGVHAEYAFSRQISAFARIDNLSNADISIWEGYKERGIFAAAGVTWRF